MRWMVMAVIAAGAVLGAVGVSHVAAAAKPEREVIEIDCGEDGTLTVELVPGNGTYTPARVVGGGVFVPVAFANTHGTFTDNEGHTETFSDPDVSKGGVGHLDTLTCHFEISFVEPEGTGSFEGDVTGFIAGRRNP